MKFLLLLNLILFNVSCKNDELTNESETGKQAVKNQEMPFNKSIHFTTLNKKIRKINTRLKNLKTYKNTDNSAIEILTDDVLFLSYGDTHTYTFKVVREKPEFWIENVVLYFDVETNSYKEYLVQYTFDENEVLNLVDGGQLENSENVIVTNLESGFFNQHTKSSCDWVAETVWDDCGSGEHTRDNISDWHNCTANPPPSAYQVWHMVCTSDPTTPIDAILDAGPSQGGGGGGGNVVSNPYTDPPCTIGQGDLGIVDSNGGCVKPNIEEECINLYYQNLSQNSPFNLDTSELCDNILPLPDDGTPEVIKLKCIYEKLTQSPKFKQLFVDTFGQSENVNVKFEIVDFNAVNGVTADGATDANVLDVRMQTIKLDRGKLLSNHPLIVAQTIIHEALHAFINVKQVYCHNNGIIATGTNQTYITNLNQLTFDELLNDFYIDCAVNQPNQHRLMYNQMVNAMDEMLEDVFNDLIAPENQDLTNNPQYMYGVPPNDGQHTFNWQDAFHYFNLNGLQQATEYQQDILQDPATPFLVGKYSIYINDPSRFNQNSCN